ncbi:MAG: M20/M25/M40 family metallo-hydrolase [Gemmatimonadetes bacterium]|nr:M20/M25/M40 family metallo-hydrolase [Gemmatimonadota bacterium]
MKLAAAWICVTLAAPLAGQGVRPDADPRIVKLVAAVSPDRLRQLSERLVSFGTRSTLSDTMSATRGVGAARRWIHRELSQYRRLQVSFDSHRLVPTGRITREVELRNVVAILPGRSPRRVYISGHYDTVNLGPGGQTRLNTGGANPQASAAFNHDNDAPGANDDGSGTILTMELARVFAESDLEFDATLVFILWAGEEQGLFGSMAHAQNLAAAKVEVTANFNNDIVGNSLGGNGVVDAETVRVYSLGPEDSPHRQLARYIQRLAATYVPSHRIRLMAREDRFGRGSDHSSFTAFDFPAVVFRESNENFARQHTAEDKIEGVDFGYLAQNARVNAAGAATVALAPPAPIVAGDRGASVSRIPSGYDATLTWRAAPGAAAYRVYWRDTWTNDWQHSQVVGNVTTFTLPNVNIDDWVFGVSAIGPDGHESLVSAYVSPPRRMQEVKVIKP